MRRAYKFRLRPSARRHIALTACVESHRELYNAALQERRDGWMHSKTRIRYTDQAAQLTEIRSVRADVAVWSYPASRLRCAGSTKPSIDSSDGSKPVGRLAIRGARGAVGSTLLNGRKMVMAPAGIRTARGCTCKASSKLRSARTAKCVGE